MTKFEIKTDHFELRFGTSRSSIPAISADEIFEAYQDRTCNCPTIEASFDTLAEARAEFEKAYATRGTTRAEKGNNWWLLVGNVFWIEENWYDEDGEFDQGGWTYDFSAEAYEAEEPISEDIGEDVKASVIREALGTDAVSADFVQNAERLGYLTFNECRNGHSAVWYYDNDGKEACFDINESRFLSAQEIETQLE